MEKELDMLLKLAGDKQVWLDRSKFPDFELFQKQIVDGIKKDI